MVEYNLLVVTYAHWRSSHSSGDSRDIYIIHSASILLNLDVGGAIFHAVLAQDRLLELISVVPSAPEQSVSDLV